MSNITDRVAYLKGLAEGMQLDKEKNAHKLLLEVISTLSDMADEIAAMSDAQDELNEYVESIDDDLADLEEVLFAEEDEMFDDDDDDESYDDDDDEDPQVFYNCPHCGFELTFNVSDIDFDDDTLCPECHKPVFPESEGEDEASLQDISTIEEAPNSDIDD